MDYRAFLTDLLATFGGVGALVLAVTLLSKLLLKHLTAKDLENFKNGLAVELASHKGGLDIQVEQEKDRLRLASESLLTDLRIELQSNANSQLEVLKNELSVKASAYQVKFSNLHLKRMEVIEELYERLVLAEHAFQALTSPFVPSVRKADGEVMTDGEYRDSKAEAAAEAGNSFNAYFVRSRLYLPKELCQKIDAVKETHGAAWSAYTVLPSFYGWEYDRDAGHQRWEILSEAWQKVSKDGPALRIEIENEFRKLVSVQGTPDQSG